MQLPDGDGLGLMTGPADRGISDVADGALISLGEVMIAFLLHGTQSPPSPLVVEEPLTKTGEPGTPEA